MTDAGDRPISGVYQSSARQGTNLRMVACWSLLIAALRNASVGYNASAADHDIGKERLTLAVRGRLKSLRRNHC